MFEYPSSFAPVSAGYIRRAVKIEMGARADHWPCETQTRHALRGRGISARDSRKEAARSESIVGGAHVLGESDHPARGVSSASGQGDTGSILAALLRLLRIDPQRRGEVCCGETGIAGACGRSQDPVLPVGQRAGMGRPCAGTLRIAPPEHRLKPLRDDYGKMQQMFFGEPPEFDRIISLLSQWESEFNQK